MAIYLIRKCPFSNYSSFSRYKLPFNVCCSKLIYSIELQRIVFYIS